MSNSEMEVSDMSLIKRFGAGLKWVTENRKAAIRTQVWLSVAAALVVAVAFGGNIGEVKTDYVTYMPFHEIAMGPFVKYAAGAFVAAVVCMFWTGALFLLLSDDAAPARLDRKQMVFAGLKFVQFCLLAFLTFGIVAGVIVYAAVKFTAWLWILFAVYVLLFSVPYYMAQCNYMLTDDNYRQSLRVAFKAVKEQWGRVFLRVLVVSALAVLFVLIVSLPATALAFAVYDNATAVSMEGAAPTPWYIFALEYVFIAVGVLASLYIIMCARSVMKAFYVESLEYSEALAEARKEEY